MTIMIISAVFIIALFTLSLIIRSLKAPTVSSGPEDQSSPAAEKKDPGADFKEILDTLIKLNLMIRTDRDFSMDLILKIESIID
ncbi:MAG: hypothetical protein MI799_07895, partial [Desulfobacterales bacterium]|nr:hypothetical protein [Desulfobacterales bacterium]